MKDSAKENVLFSSWAHLNGIICCMMDILMIIWFTFVLFFVFRRRRMAIVVKVGERTITK